MDRAARKLHSSRGAAMVLALVFLLVCVLVGVSVLMAAASNAGRSGSNRQEQQYYLALSSALQLVSDDLQESSYVGRVQYDPHSGTTPRQYTSQDGVLTGVGIFDTTGVENNLIKRFRRALDDSFGLYIVKYLKSQEKPGVSYEYTSFNASIRNQTTTFDLTLQDGGLKEYKFQIVLSVEENLNIILNATITDIPDGVPEMLKSYTMEMELRPAELPTITEPADKTDHAEATAVKWIADRVTHPIVTPTAAGG